MDGLERSLKGLDLRRETSPPSPSSSGSEWRSVPASRRGNAQNRQQSAASAPVPLIPVSRTRFPIYQIPKHRTTEGTLTLLNTVLDTGPETVRLFLEVTQRLYLKEIVILRGVPGSGKSAIASALLSVTTNGVICSADDYFTDSRGRYNFNSGRLGEAHSTAQARCKRHMSLGSTPIIIDNTNTRRFEMEPYVRLAVEFNYAVRVFQPETPWRVNARVCAAKNVHQVPKAKIQEMIERFEQVLPSLLVDNVVRDMGEVGKRYAPQKKEVEEPKPGSIQPLIPPNFLPTPQPPPSTPGKAGTPPTVSDFVLHSLASPQRSKGKMKRKGSPQQKAAGGSQSKASSGPPTPVNKTEYSAGLVNNAKLLRSHFPSCRMEDLLDLLEKLNNEVDDAMNVLIDSGYAMAPEPVKEVNEGPRGAAGSGEEGAVGGAVDGGKTGPEEETPEKEDFFQLSLSNDFLRKIVSLYGDVSDPKVKKLLKIKSGLEVKLNPAVSFELYRKLVENAEAKAFKEAEAAAKD